MLLQLAHLAFETALAVELCKKSSLVFLLVRSSMGDGLLLSASVVFKTGGAKVKLTADHSELSSSQYIINPTYTVSFKGGYQELTELFSF